MRRSLAALVLALMLPLPVLAAQVTVKPGETLSEIADRHGVSLSRLMQLNGISRADHVEVGQVLKLPGHARSSSASARATGSVRVQEGDTLSEIASRQGMSLSELMALNGISRADHVEIGQVLRVTGRPQPPAPTYPRGSAVHVVKPGESLSEIAEGYGVAMSRLVAINQLDDANHVEVGRRLKLKGSAPAAPAPRPASASAPAPRPAPAPRAAVPATAPVSRATEAAARPSQPLSERIASTPAKDPGSQAATPTPQIIATAQATPAPAAAARSQAPETVAAARSQAPAALASASPTSSASTTAEAARPSFTPRRSLSPAVAATTTARASAPAATTIARASAPAATASPAASASAPLSSADWRRYGPLRVDWSGWQPMGGSLVAPVMNAKGDTLYLAINCGARKLNATSVAGDWRTWDSPQADFEQRLVSDLCRSRAS